MCAEDWRAAAAVAATGVVVNGSHASSDDANLTDVML
jgi:hypothetical protein